MSLCVVDYVVNLNIMFNGSSVQYVHRPSHTGAKDCTEFKIYLKVSAVVEKNKSSALLSLSLWVELRNYNARFFLGKKFTLPMFVNRIICS